MSACAPIVLLLAALTSAGHLSLNSRSNAQQEDPREISPEAVKCWNAGMAAKRAKKLDEAIAEFKKAIKLCPHYVDAHWGLAWCYADSKTQDEAIDAFRQVIAHDISDGEKMKMALDALRKLKGELPKRTFVVSLDGSERRCLGLPTLPVESPLGGKLVFAWKYEVQRLPDIYLADVNGEVKENLTNTPRAWERNPAWSPDGESIAFTWQKSATSGGLSVLDIASGRKTILLQDMIPDEVAWAPDGKRIAFRARGQLWVMPATGGERKPLTQRGARARSPEWSPDGEKIAYQAWADDNWDIFVISSEGGNPIQLTDNPGHDFAPLWFPDGEKILFASTRDARGERITSDLYVLDVATGRATRLTDTPESEGKSSWSADGKSVYVQANLPMP